MTQDAHPRVLRKRRIIAWWLIAAGVPLLFVSYWLYEPGTRFSRASSAST